MTAVAKKIEQEIQQLTLEEMLALHELFLIAIRAREEDKALDPEYRKEIMRRIDEINSGKTEGVSAFSALEEM